MARLARIVVPGRARRVTQRAHRRDPIFFREGDRSIFLGKWKPYTYDTASNVVTVTLPNGIVSTSHYDQLNRLTSLTSQVSSYTYQLSPTGNRTSSSELNGRTLTWNYNGVYQLTEQTVAADPAGVDGSATYGLDPVGNRLSTSSTLSGILNGTYAYNPDDEVGSETYDRNGNVLTEGGKSFTYDSENRLMTMNGGAVAIVYDGDGNRVAETVGGATTRYLVDDLNPTGYAQVIDEVISGVAVRGYALGLQRIDENQPISGTWTPSFYGYDGGGTVRQLTNLSGTVTDTYDYNAFGYLLSSTGTTPNNYLYRGEQYDPNLSLYYLRARYYNPATGRFMSRDPEDGKPVDPGTLHKYLYASGDPINRADPTGRYSTAGTIPGQVGFGDAVGEYVVLVLQATAAVVAVAAVGCAANIAYTVDALRTPGGSTAAIKVDLPHCSANKDCEPYEEAIQTALAEVIGRYNELLADIHGLYGLYCKNPNSTTKWGSWTGHLFAYEQAQLDLQNAIAEARDAGCPIPPEALEWESKPPPSCPE